MTRPITRLLILCGLVTLATTNLGRVCADVVSYQEGQSGYAGTQDTWIGSGASMVDTAHGTEDAFVWDIADSNPTNINISLLRFDSIVGVGAGQIPVGSEIQSATLSLTVFDAGSGVRVHRMLTSWSESDTWNTLVNGVSTDDVDAVSSPDDQVGAQTNGTNIAVGLLVLDVTNSLKAWVGDSQAAVTNNGWVLHPLTPGGINGIGVRSSEFGTANVRPSLTVEFTPIPEPSTFILTALGLLSLGVTRRRRQRA